MKYIKNHIVSTIKSIIRNAINVGLIYLIGMIIAEFQSKEHQLNKVVYNYISHYYLKPKKASVDIDLPLHHLIDNIYTTNGTFRPSDVNNTMRKYDYLFVQVTFNKRTIKRYLKKYANEFEVNTGFLYKYIYPLLRIKTEPVEAIINDANLEDILKSIRQNAIKISEKCAKRLIIGIEIKSLKDAEMLDDYLYSNNSRLLYAIAFANKHQEDIIKNVYLPRLQSKQQEDSDELDDLI